MEGSTDDNTGLRVASFSCYLDAAEEKISPTKFVLKDPTPFTFPQEPRKNGEISIFGADKYFSMKLDYQIKGEGPVTLARTGSNHGPRTPSQTALLQRNGSQTKQKKAIGRGIFSGFGCMEPCFNRKDVHIQKEEKDRIANTEEPRTSIEVFGSKTTSTGDVAKNMERKLSILTWDAIPKAQKQPTSTVGSRTVCDDMASEASSDLFEIDNISVSHYAPSEASIQWSVVSASDCNEENSVRVTGGDDVMSKTNNRSCKSRINGGLLGCKSLKSVEVSGRANERGKHQGLDLSVSLGKSQPNQKL